MYRAKTLICLKKQICRIWNKKTIFCQCIAIWKIKRLNYIVLNDFRYVKSLVVLMVDLLDFPCSIWPGIIDIIGTDRPIIIVGNKVTCLTSSKIYCFS